MFEEGGREKEGCWFAGWLEKGRRSQGSRDLWSVGSSCTSRLYAWNRGVVDGGGVYKAVLSPPRRVAFLPDSYRPLGANEQLMAFGLPGCEVSLQHAELLAGACECMKRKTDNLVGLVMLTASWGTSLNGWVICYGWSQFIYGQSLIFLSNPYSCLMSTMTDRSPGPNP
jgi:hypothetical protein